jgi:hypothetical protein
MKLDTGFVIASLVTTIGILYKDTFTIILGTVLVCMSIIPYRPAFSYNYNVIASNETNNIEKSEQDIEQS